MQPACQLDLAAVGVIQPALGALLHNGGALFVVVNSARLLALAPAGGAGEEQR